MIYREVKNLFDTILIIILVSHGWAHIWYIILSQQLLEIKEKVAWTGESWILTNLMDKPSIRTIAGIGYTASLIGFIAGDITLGTGHTIWKQVITASIIISSITITLFWDGKPEMLIDKGLLGLVINLALITYLNVIDKLNLS